MTPKFKVKVVGLLTVLPMGLIVQAFIYGFFEVFNGHAPFFLNFKSLYTPINLSESVN